MAEGSIGPGGHLNAKLVRADGKEVHHPFLADLFARLEAGVEDQIEKLAFRTNLIAHHRDADGNIVDHSDTHIVLPDGGLHLGSGLVTNAGVNFMVDNDVNNRLASGAINNFKYHAIGTGTTAAAAADYYLQTAQGATNLSGTTNGYMTGTNTVVAPNQWKSVATFTATGAIAVTEWVLAMSNAANFSRTATGTPTATTFPDSGAAFTTSGNGLTGWTIEISSTAVNTPTTTVMGLVTSNTATSLTIAEGWFTLANAGASTPGANGAYVVYPTAFDHKVFSVINMANGDTLQFTYTNTVNSGG